MSLWLPKREVWTRQPPRGTHPRLDGIGKDISFVWSGADPITKPIFWKHGRGQVLTADGTITHQAIKGGVAAAFAVSATLDGVNGYPAVVTSKSDGTGSFTLLCVFKIENSASSKHALFGQRTPDSPYEQVYFLANSIDSGPDPGELAFAGYAGGFVNVYGTDVLDDNVHIAAGRRVSSTLELWFDGAYLGASGTFTTTILDQTNPSTTGLSIGGRYNDTALDDGTPEIALCAAWDRALTNAEMQNVTRNPWQIFE